MTEYVIHANSFAAPFFSDTSTCFVEAESPKAALERFAAEYTHPCGLFSAVCHRSADAFHKGEKPLAQWQSNHVKAQKKATEGLGGYTYQGHAPGDFEIDGKRKEGSVIVEEGEA